MFNITARNLVKIFSQSCSESTGSSPAVLSHVIDLSQLSESVVGQVCRSVPLNEYLQCSSYVDV